MMKILVVLAALAALSHAKSIEEPSGFNPVFGYLVNTGIPEAERIRKAEEEYLSNPNRIAGGSPSAIGEHPWQTGLLINIVGIDGVAICGGSVISNQRVVTAAHCWNDGQNNAWLVTVVLGSVFLFTGGIRQETSAVITHPSWSPRLVRNDVAVIYLPSAVSFSNSIQPIDLPYAYLTDTFAGDTAVASGFGMTGDSAGITTNQFLSHVSVNVITNTVCSFAYPTIVQSSNICISGQGGTSTCRGDSGGPLSVVRNNRRVLIGITSFGSAFGCEIGLPAVFARVTSFLDFLQQHI